MKSDIENMNRTELGILAFLEHYKRVDRHSLSQFFGIPEKESGNMMRGCLGNCISRFVKKKIDKEERKYLELADAIKKEHQKKGPTKSSK